MNKRFAVLALGFLVASTGASQAAALDVIPVPTVTPPSLPVPLPPVPTVPPVQVPALPVPTPSAPVPSVPLPAPVPSVPVPAPAPGGSSSPAGGSAPAARSGAGTSAPSSAGASVRGGSSGSVRSNGAGTPGGGQAGASGTRGGGPSGATPRAGGHDARRAAERSRALRRTVLALRACLPRLSRLQSRVLRLRAGIGPGGPRSTAAVARIVGRPLRQVRRVERRAIRRLRAEAREGCGGAIAPDGAGATDIGITADAGLAALAPATGDDGGAEPAPMGGGGGSTRRVDAKDGERSGVLGLQDESTAPPLAKLFPGSPPGSDITLPVLAGLLVAAFLVAGRLRRRRD